MEEKEKILSEETFSLADMAAHLGCSYHKLHRLTTRGARAVDGRVVQLAVIFTESGKKTSREAYHRFLVELNKEVDDAAS